MSWWESLVQIRCSDGEKGSGILIGPSEVLTAAHVVSRGGVALDATQLTVDIRYQSLLAVPVGVALLPAWAGGQPAASDMALIKVEPRADLGVPVAFGVPPLGASAMLEGYGFEAQQNSDQRVIGNVECRVDSTGGHLLYTQDFSPLPGMSGGPLCVNQTSGVHVCGLLIRQSPSGLIGVQVIASALAQLRAQL